MRELTEKCLKKTERIVELEGETAQRGENASEKFWFFP